jgi:hypothetical protein
MTWIAAIVVTALLAGGLATWWMAAGESWRWGRLRRPGPQMGDGPYRSAPVVVEIPRRLPAIAGVASVLSVSLGLVTLLVFAPAGVVLSTIALPGSVEGVPEAVAALAVTGVTMSGFVIAMRLIGAPRLLVVRGADSAARVRAVAIHGALHHALAAATFAFMHAVVEAWPLLTVAAIPCAIGLAVAGLLGGASAVISRIDREDAREAQDA